MANHIIHRVNLELEAPDQQSARVFHDRASWILKNDILPALENYLDSLGWEEEFLRLNELNINIDILRKEQIETELTNMVMAQIRELLDKKSRDNNGLKKDNSRQLSREEKIFETFLHFLLTGRLPWWSSAVDTEKYFASLPELFRTPNKTWQQRLKELVKNYPRAIHRLLLQFPEKTLVAAIFYILPDEQQSQPAIRNEIRQAIRRYSKDGSLSLAGISFAPLHQIQKQTATVEEKSSETLHHTSEEEEGLFTRHAGLVLLHPFLESFLGEPGWVKNGMFISTEARIQAAHLLAYLVTGEENLMEHEMILEKYLCGINLEEPVPSVVPLDETMKQECEKLLNAVIKHWKVLKNTSPAGLREAFLKREGKLLITDSQHQLIVEHKSTDILLGRLPWGYQVIKLPWMPVPLLVEWTH